MLVASLGLPIAIAGSGTSEILAAGAFVVGVYLAANASAVGAREAEHSPALDRAFGVSARAVRLLRLMVPTLVCFVWSVAALAFLRGDLGAWIPLLVLFAPGIAASAVKAAYRNPPNWSAPLVVTPMGAYPPGVVNSLATGPILAIIASLPVIVALFVGPQQIIGMVQVIITSILVLVASHTKRRK